MSEDVDLQQDGHITLLFTPEEEVQARADFVAAKEAGVQGLDTVRFIDAETMNKVRPHRSIRMNDNAEPVAGMIDPRDTLPRNLWPRQQPLAAQARQCALQPRPKRVATSGAHSAHAHAGHQHITDRRRC